MYQRKRLWEAREDPRKKKRRMEQEQTAKEEKKSAEEQQETISKRTEKEDAAMILAVQELKRKESNVIRKTGETKGGVEITIDVDKVSEKEQEATEQLLQSERRQPEKSSQAM